LGCSLSDRTCSISCWSRSGGVRGFTPLTGTCQPDSPRELVAVCTSPIFESVFVADMRIGNMELNATSAATVLCMQDMFITLTDIVCGLGKSDTVKMLLEFVKSKIIKM
jgi:uncharacterized protein related to proFAR isomerase